MEIWAEPITNEAQFRHLKMEYEKNWAEPEPIRPIYVIKQHKVYYGTICTVPRKNQSQYGLYKCKKNSVLAGPSPI